VTLRLLTYNIRFGGIGREAALAEAIRRVDADVVVFQEATSPRVIEEIARETGYPTWGARRAHSIGYVSRVPVERHAWHHPRGARHAFLEVVLASGLRVFGLHLSAWFSRWSERRRLQEIRALLAGIAEHREGFHVLVGDFNTLAPGELLQARRMPGWIQAMIWLSGRDIQRETIQAMLDAQYVDGFRRLHPEREGFTFPTWDPHLRLDYVFVPAGYADRLSACEVVVEPPAPAASDHFPLLAHLELRATAPSPSPAQG
jgi:endonuclease/exonuclease/phosphatase family metal-dependent hydrolase